MTLSGPLLLVLTLVPGQEPATDFAHDFRGGRALPSSLSLMGPDVDEVITREVEGLRIKLPTDGRQTKGWGVRARFTLSGDFEVTGSYELITVDPPTKGNGVGVALNLAPDGQRLKFAKIGRFLRMKDSVVVAETWNREPTVTHCSERERFR